MIQILFDKYLVFESHFLQNTNNFFFFVAIPLLLGFFVLLYIVAKILKRCYLFAIRRQAATSSTCELDRDTSQAAAAAAAVIAQAVAAQKRSSNRLCSLDAFRGLAIVTMIFANSGCGEYHWIEHASWNGIHLADFIFPSFLWIMGVCIPISLKSQFAKNIPRPDMLSNIFIVSR